MATLIDSYSEGNMNSNTTVRDGTNIAIGQSFTSNGMVLDSCKFYICKSGSPTGNCYAKVYAHTGTFGTTGKPTGSALATSDAIDVSTLNTFSTFALKTFTFSGANKILLSSTYYVVVFEYSGGSSGNAAVIGVDTTTPTHSGNRSSYITSWSYTSDWDVPFYVYGNPVTLKKYMGVASASIKKAQGVAKASAKKINKISL